MDDEQETEALTEAEVEEAKAVEAKVMAEAEETAGIRAFGNQETCETCHHQFQLVCQRDGIGKTKPVKLDGHCSLWE